MEITRSEAENPRSAGRRFRRALRRVLGFAALLWLILLVDALAGVELKAWGVHPRSWDGLWGLVTMPLLHGGMGHLVANSLPLVTLGVGLLFFYPETCWRVLPWFWVLPGVLVWLIGTTGSTHFGASGLNFALLAYLGLGGVLRRTAASAALSMVVLFYYGGMLRGVLPMEPGVSWEGHLGGALAGTLLAVFYRHRDRPPRKVYSWELEEDEDVVDGEDAPLGAEERATRSDQPWLH